MHSAMIPVLHDPERLPPAFARPVLAIGNVDGVHRGHKALLAAARALADRLGRPCGLLTFEPHPREVFRPDEAHFRLSSPADRAIILTRLGLDLVIVQSFDEGFRVLAHGQFEDRILGDQLAVSGVVVGPDFRYGQGRSGSPATLRLAGQRLGFEVDVMTATVDDGDQPVSSTTIRECLASGNVERASQLLGHAWFVHARVEHGDKRGRLLGFPTANLHLPASCGLAYGIYAVRARVGGQMIDGIASFGRRPTFDNGPAKLEVFLFDFSADLYGKELGVEFVAHIRGELKFDSVDDLVKRMHRDCQQAQNALRQPRPVSMLGD